jgi:hypothetical protein
MYWDEQGRGASGLCLGQKRGGVFEIMCVWGLTTRRWISFLDAGGGNS